MKNFENAKLQSTEENNVKGGGSYNTYFAWYRSYVAWFYTPSAANAASMNSAYDDYANC